MKPPATFRKGLAAVVGKVGEALDDLADKIKR